MASGTGTLDNSAGAGGVKAAIRKPALKLQSDERLAKLGPAGFETVTDRYRQPLTKHAAGIVGTEKAGAVVDRAVHQARGLYRSDSRASAPGPWLYWMTHNLAVTEQDNGNGSSNGHSNGHGNGNGNGNGAIAAAAVATNGSSNGHANGHANGTANGAANGNGTAAALTTLTYTEGAAQFTQDDETRKLAKGTRVRVRNGVGQLVPTPLLREPKAQTGAGRPTKGEATAAAAAGGNRRTAIIFFGLCTLAVIAAFALDRIDNVDPGDFNGNSIPGQPTTIVPQTGVPATPGVPPTGTGIPPTGTTTTPPAGTTTTPPPAGTSTTPGTTPSTAPPVTGTTPPASGTTSPSAPTTTTPTPTGSTPPASTTGNQQGGFTALLTALGVNPTVAQTNPLLTVMGFFGLTETPATPRPAKTPKPAKLPKSTGTTPAPIAPAPTGTTPTVTPAPTKPKAIPLGNAGPTISYNAAKGQANDVTIRKSGNRYKISDGGVSTLPINSGCRSTGSTSEICKTAGVTSFDIDLGDRDDVLDLSKVGKPVTIAGGKGDDTITGGSGKDILDGGVGSDRLEGVNGVDTVTGGKGDDSLDGGKGNDVLSGEAGNDSITGGAGTDSVEAGSGDDSIDVRDGKADSVTCGSGSDSVVADSIDQLAGDCESVSKS